MAVEIQNVKLVKDGIRSSWRFYVRAANGTVQVDSTAALLNFEEVRHCCFEQRGYRLEPMLNADWCKEVCRALKETQQWELPPRR